MIFINYFSNFISKVKQGGDERTKQTVHITLPGESEEANAVSPMKWNWNYMVSRKCFLSFTRILLCLSCDRYSTNTLPTR